MKLTCIQCEKSFSFCDSVEVLYSDEGIYFFCNEYCRDNWASEVALLSESEDLQQSSAETHLLPGKHCGASAPLFSSPPFDTTALLFQQVCAISQREFGT